jgi:hypothetical protein
LSITSEALKTIFAQIHIEHFIAKEASIQRQTGRWLSERISRRWGASGETGFCGRFRLLNTEGIYHESI